MTADELVEKAKEQRQRGRFEEALISARQAAILDPQNPDAFWQVALSQIALGPVAKAVTPLENVVLLAPRFAPGWTKLGLALLQTGDKLRAKKHFEKAVQLDSDETDAFVELATLYERDKQPEEELGALTALEALVDLTAYQLNRLGILHHDRKDFYLAIQYYRKVAAKSSSPAGFFNLGLAFNEPEVSQDVDAVDAWRRVIERDPGHERAPKSIASVMPKLTELRRRVQAQTKPLLDQNQWYSCYINPYELLRLDVDLDLEDIDVKALQRARKTLLQEIELEDGRIEWMPGLQIDRSKAIGICDELNDPIKAAHHFQIFSNPPLSMFLQRGELDHFLVDEAESPIALIEYLEDDDLEFYEWLSPSFAKQFDSLLTQAIKQRNVVAVECLLDGRRWVTPEDEDKCFEGSHREVDRLLSPLRTAADRSETTKPTLTGVQALLADGGIGEILGLLPVAFYKEQQEAAALVRSISIAAYNQHEDAELAKAILKLAEGFALKSPSLQHRIKEDLATLDERIKSAREDEVHLTFGRQDFKITREGARYGDRFIPLNEVRTLRWGTVVTRHNGVVSMAFSIAIGGLKAQEITVQWTATKDHDVQRELFGKMSNAATSYLLPRIVETIEQDLDHQERVRIGSVVLTKEGVEFMVEGWFSSKAVICPWSRVRSEIANGDVVIADPINRKATATLALNMVDNAAALHILACRNN